MTVTYTLESGFFRMSTWICKTTIKFSGTDFFCLYFALEVQASLTTTSLKSMYLHYEMEAGQRANCMESAQGCWF